MSLQSVTAGLHCSAVYQSSSSSDKYTVSDRLKMSSHSVVVQVLSQVLHSALKLHLGNFIHVFFVCVCVHVCTYMCTWVCVSGFSSPIFHKLCISTSHCNGEKAFFPCFESSWNVLFMVTLK